MEEERRFTEVKPPRSMRFDVLRQLRNAILDGTLKPGERLNESVIAREMGISRGPVREAILALEQEGLVETVHWRGSYVVEPDPTTFGELVDLRILLETHAAKVATKRCGANSLAELGAIIERMREVGAKGEIEQVVDADLSFHRAICRLSGNAMLLKMWEQLAGRIRLAVLLSIEKGYDAITMVETHPPVLEAMRAGDGELAASRLNQRTREAADLIVAGLMRRGAANT
jgi:DNA-binding GntR family transcriptional regulator